MSVVKTALLNASETPCKLSFDLSAKMDKMLAHSTNSRLIPLCQKRREGDVCGICEHCFAGSSIDGYDSFRENTTANLKTMQEVLPIGELPEIDPFKAPYFRFESHGDLFCRNQAVNYLNIAAYNRFSQFALWTKNPWWLAAAIKYVGKPVNLRCIYSYYFVVNSDSDMAKARKRWQQVKKTYGDLFDSIFIVLGKEYAGKHPELVNCGARSCYTCHRCYDGNDEFIYEVLK